MFSFNHRVSSDSTVMHKDQSRQQVNLAKIVIRGLLLITSFYAGHISAAQVQQQQYGPSHHRFERGVVRSLAGLGAYFAVMKPTCWLIDKSDILIKQTLIKLEMPGYEKVRNSLFSKSVGSTLPAGKVFEGLVRLGFFTIGIVYCADIVSRLFCYEPRLQRVGGDNRSVDELEYAWLSRFNRDERVGVAFLISASAVGGGATLLYRLLPQPDKLTFLERYKFISTGALLGNVLANSFALFGGLVMLRSLEEHLLRQALAGGQPLPQGDPQPALGGYPAAVQPNLQPGAANNH